MKRILLVVVLLFSTCPAFATCLSLDDAREQVAGIPGAVLTELNEPALANAVELFNTFVPPDAPETETVALIDLPDGGGFMAGGPSGEVCGLVRFDPQRWIVIRISIFGRDA